MVRGRQRSWSLSHAGRIGESSIRTMRIARRKQKTPGVACEPEPVQARGQRIGWARLLERVFDIDLRRCPSCGAGGLEIIAAILERAASVRNIAAGAPVCVSFIDVFVQKGFKVLSRQRRSRYRRCRDRAERRRLQRLQPARRPQRRSTVSRCPCRMLPAGRPRTPRQDCGKGSAGELPDAYDAAWLSRKRPRRGAWGTWAADQRSRLP
jgi:hypothetical protein